MGLFERLNKILKPWAFDEYSDSVYVTHGGVAYVRAYLKSHGLGYIKVYRRDR